MQKPLSAEIYLDRVGRFKARIGEIRNTGHRITEDSGRFTVYSITMRGNRVLSLNTTRDKAEADITAEWLIFSAARTPGTSRDRDIGWEELPLERKLAELNLRGNLAEKQLRPLLQPGDRIRATKAECGSREASFTFSHWDGGWIVSNGGSSISPCSVYSINGKVFEV